MKPEQALKAAGQTLPVEHPTVATYARAVTSGSLLFVSGHGSFIDGRPAHTGKLGTDLTVEQGREAARAVMLNILTTLKVELGELDRIARFVKLLVFVNATDDFEQHHLVANGSTDLLVAIFGDIGRPARSAVGLDSLPFDFAVEVEAVVETRLAEMGPPPSTDPGAEPTISALLTG